MPEQTPSQTVGPFFSIGLINGGENVMVNEQTAGERITIEGRVLDGAGEPVLDAMVEIWQADAHGIFNHERDPRQAQADPHFRGFGRSQTTEDGRFWFRTVRPGAVPAANDERAEDASNTSVWQAPHVNVIVFARGMLIHAVTRIYFEDEEANAQDPLLASLPEARRQTLIAPREQAADGLARYRLDIVLQGDNETVFLDV